MPAYRPDIDGLRAVAVVPVVLFHAGIPGFAGGFVGVDVFLVISGFLITGFLRDDLERGHFSVLRFYERRARRILPALIAVIATTTGVGYFMLMPVQYVDFAQSAIAATVFAANFWFREVAGDYFAPAAEFMPLLHTWSLGIEEQFYIVFPLLLWLLSRRSRFVVVSTLSALTVLSLALSVLAVRDWPDAAFYSAPLRAWELGLGALLALRARPRLLSRWPREFAAAAGLAGILAAVILYHGQTPFPGIAALLPCLGAVALIQAGIHGPSLVGRALSWRPVVFVGLISYSLYLWHWPILAFLRVRLGQVELPPAVAATAIVASLGLAVLSWAYIEMPFRRRPPDGPRGVTIFRLAGGTMATILVIATLIRVGDGLPSRLPHDVHMAYAAARDNNPSRTECFNNWPGDDLCRFPASIPGTRAPEFLLWGDSHADAIMPGVGEAAERAGVSGVFAGKSACPPLRGVDRADKGRRHGCARFNEAVLEYLRKHESISVVILAARWALAAEAERAPGEGGNPAYLIPTDSWQDDEFGVERNFEVFRQGIEATIDTIRSMDRRVVIVGNIPEIGWDVPRHSIARARWGDSLPPAPMYSEVVRRQGRADDVLARLSEQPGVHFLAIATRLCNPECRTHMADRPIYFDDDHLSRFGSIQVITPLLSDFLRPPADGSGNADGNG